MTNLDRKDYYYKKAKAEKYRSRASYKLEEIDSKFHIFKKGQVILDLGAAPGGWSQVASEKIGKDGMIIAVDLNRIRKISNVQTLQGDIFDRDTLENIKQKLSGKEVDVVLSDMAPHTSGDHSLDHARSIGLAERCFEISLNLLKEDGALAIKVFNGDLYKEFFNTVKKQFGLCKTFIPKATRKTSSEVYIISKKFKRF